MPSSCHADGLDEAHPPLHTAPLVAPSCPRRRSNVQATTTTYARPRTAYQARLCGPVTTSKSGIPHMNGSTVQHKQKALHCWALPPMWGKGHRRGPPPWPLSPRAVPLLRSTSKWVVACDLAAYKLACTLEGALIVSTALTPALPPSAPCCGRSAGGHLRERSGT